MKKMKFWKGGAVLLTVLLMVFCGRTDVCAQTEDRALNGIFIDNVEISQMTEEEAMETMQAAVRDRMDDRINFTMTGDSFALTAEDLGYTWLQQEDLIHSAVSYGKSGNIISRYKIEKDLEQKPKVFSMDIGVDTSKVQTILEDASNRYNMPMQPMGLRHESDGSFTILDGTAGYQLNVGASLNTITWYMKANWHGGDTTIALVEEVQDPDGDRAMLEEVQDLLGTCYTEYGNGSASRAVNIKNGAQKINGTLLYPGESFSFLDATLPFTEDNGYEKGKSYESGRVVESIGGGVCQVSSTLYVALIRAEIQIDQRYCHSMRVSYVSPSMDAAVAEYAKDLKFTNNQEYPIYIEAVTDGWSIHVNIYGKETRNPDRTVDFEPEIVENADPTVDMEAVLWKVVKENGEETRTEFNHSIYYLPKTDPEESTTGDKPAEGTAQEGTNAEETPAEGTAAEGDSEGETSAE